MLDAARARALSADLAGERFALDSASLGAEARARVAKVAADWSGLHRLLYARLLELEEPDRAPGAQDRIGRLVAEGRHEEALAALAEIRAQRDDNALLDCVGITENAGDDAQLEGEHGRASAYLSQALAPCGRAGGVEVPGRARISEDGG